MTNPNRYAVPIDRLDGVRVEAAEQVEEQALLPASDTGSWTGALAPAHGDGAGQDADGD